MSVEQLKAAVENDSIEDRLYTVKYEDAGQSHLDVTDHTICAKECQSGDCVTVCPADVWSRDDDGVPSIAYENCLECASCRYACPHDNVVWEYPETGAGVTFKFG